MMKYHTLQMSPHELTRLKQALTREGLALMSNKGLQEYKTIHFYSHHLKPGNCLMLHVPHQVLCFSCLLLLAPTTHNLTFSVVCLQFPAGMLGPAFHCPDHVLAAFNQYPTGQLYVVGKVARFITIPLAGRSSLWVELALYTPHPKGSSFKTISPNIVLSGSAQHWIPLSIPGEARPQWTITH